MPIAFQLNFQFHENSVYFSSFSWLFLHLLLHMNIYLQRCGMLHSSDFAPIQSQSSLWLRQWQIHNLRLSQESNRQSKANQR